MWRSSSRPNTSTSTRKSLLSHAIGTSMPLDWCSRVVSILPISPLSVRKQHGHSTSPWLLFAHTSWFLSWNKVTMFMQNCFLILCFLMFLEMPIALDQAWFYQINIYGWGRMLHLKRTYFHHVLSKIISQRGWFSFQTNVSVNKMHLTSGYHIQGWMGSTARFPGWLQGSAFPFAKDDFPFEVQCQPGIDETSSGWLDKFWLQWLQSSGKLIYYLSNTVVLYCVCFGVDWA